MTINSQSRLSPLAIRWLIVIAAVAICFRLWHYHGVGKYWVEQQAKLTEKSKPKVPAELPEPPVNFPLGSTNRSDTNLKFSHNTVTYPFPSSPESYIKIENGRFDCMHIESVSLTGDDITARYHNRCPLPQRHVWLHWNLYTKEGVMIGGNSEFLRSYSVGAHEKGEFTVQEKGLQNPRVASVKLWMD